MRAGAGVVLAGAIATRLGSAGLSEAASSVPIQTVSLSPDTAGYRPALDTHAWRNGIAGERTQVVVLGMTHLNQLPSFDRSSLEPLLGKLLAFRPTIITHEGMSGEACETIRQNPVIYPGIFDDYCESSQPAQTAAGMDFAQARAAVEDRLADWPTAPLASDRRKLILLFMASSDSMSAQVQWRQLPAGERIAADGLDDALVAELNKVPSERDHRHSRGPRRSTGAGAGLCR